MAETGGKDKQMNRFSNRFDFKADLVGVVVAFVIGALAMIPLVLYIGWALSVVWNWFVPNIFTQAPDLAVLEAVGLVFIARLFSLAVTDISSPTSDNDDESLSKPLIEAIGYIAGVPLIVGMAWIVQSIAF